MNLPKLAAPSQAAQLNAMRTTQAASHKLMVLNGHPANLVGPPITVYHPVFAEFMADASSNEPVPDAMYKTTSDFALFSRELHPEDGRAGKMDADLRKLFGQSFGRTTLYPADKKIEPDGEQRAILEQFPDTPETIAMLWEDKCNMGAGGCDPIYQGEKDYQHLTRVAEVSYYSELCQVLN